MKHRYLRGHARTDANSPEIVAALRLAGGLWVPQDWPIDGWAGRGGVWIPVEIKDGSKIPSRQALTDDQVAFFRDCSAYKLPFAVVKSPEDILAAVGAIR